jgi:hypothetical protein
MFGTALQIVVPSNRSYETKQPDTTLSMECLADFAEYTVLVSSQSEVVRTHASALWFSRSQLILLHCPRA